MLELVLAPLALGALLIVLTPRRAAPAVSLLSIATSLAFAAENVLAFLRGETRTGLGGMLRLDGPGALVLSLVLTLGFVAALVSSQTEHWARRFHALLLTFTATMALAATSDNLGLLWASIEATTLSSALLVGHRRTRESTEAAWKYVILSSTGILFAFVATLLIALAGRDAGGATLSWTGLLRQAGGMDTGLVRLALVLATVGYGTKAGLAPFHFWLPDAHGEAPSPVSGLLSGVLLSCALLALDRFARLSRAAGDPLSHLHLAIGALSVLVGGSLVFSSRTYKRLLAYSSVENMGLVAFSVGLGTPLAMVGAYLHILAHGAAKSLAFFSAGRIHHHVETTTMADARDLLSRAPGSARGLLVGLLALAGLPPLAPFASKLLILAAALPAVSWQYLAPVLAGLVLAFVGFMRHAATMMPPPAPRAAGALPPRGVREPGTVVAALSLLVVANFLLFLFGPTLVAHVLNLGGGSGGRGP